MLGKSFLALNEFTKTEIASVLELASKLKEEQKNGNAKSPLVGKTLAMIFQHPSNRTRLSFEVGMHQLGGSSINIRPDEVQLGLREPIKDVARVMSRFVDAVMLRVAKHTDLLEFANYSSVPVINGLSDLHHPCQAVADLLTIQEHKGELKNLKVSYIGDGSNVCNSLIHACSLFDLEISVACPKGFEPTLDKAYDKLEVTHEPDKGIKNADVVYTDVWTSMGQEEEKERRLKKFKGYTINKELFHLAKHDAIFMHCLPAHRGEEVTDDIVEHPRSVVFDQAENRLHAQKAILVKLLKS
ncbi:MAG: ornithine carbamoyltransferase [Proteobacteria bacterium]|nr:ornithine carbamoyltransferase [Pseudomonadota bacterium]